MMRRKESCSLKNRILSHENDFYEQMYSYQEGADEDLPNEYVAEVASNVNDEDESVFSDVVQDAFKKYQNEVSYRSIRYPSE